MVREMTPVAPWDFVRSESRNNLRPILWLIDEAVSSSNTIMTIGQSSSAGHTREHLRRRTARGVDLW